MVRLMGNHITTLLGPSHRDKEDDSKSKNMMVLIGMPVSSPHADTPDTSNTP